MQDIYKCFPYIKSNYNQNFITLKVLERIQLFGKDNPIIEKIYAKGSIVYGMMINGSDIDHVRIKTKKPLSLSQKKELVDNLKKSLSDLNISKIQRIEEDNYIRVFYDYRELINYPLAITIKDEIYPIPHLVKAKNKKIYMRKIYKRAYKYNSKITLDWISKYKERFKLL